MASFKEVNLDEAVGQADRNMDEIDQYIKKQTDKWRDTPLNVAVIGSSGQGKSSLINAILGLSDIQDKRAEVGVIETTLSMTSYIADKSTQGSMIPFRAKTNENIAFWDLPGVGTSRFPRDTYLDIIGFEKYDFFIIVSAQRFTEDDKWLAEKIITQKSGAFFFVRSKVDSDLANDKRAHPRSHCGPDMLENIRNYTMESIGSHSVPVFLVSSFHPEMYDLESMTNLLVEKLPKLQLDALAMSLTTMTKAILNKKQKIMRDRLWKVARESSRRDNKYTFRGCEVNANIELLALELMFQKKQFGMKCGDERAMCAFVRNEIKNKTYNKALQYVEDNPSIKYEGGVHYACSYTLLSDHLIEAKKYAEEQLSRNVSGVNPGR